MSPFVGKRVVAKVNNLGFNNTLLGRVTKVYVPHTSSTTGTVIPIYQGECNTRFIAELYV
ncbi:hypothetical protein IIM_01313 [Bacillus cereus VD107]|nr:hypothetical protein IIM_01313 [Bacillus cereus VD107]PFE56002.1 hypothetical protein CN318_12200 [Bacillus cereus]PFJ07561.1 hypothetical protein COI88_01905 [Bacillus cereus]PGU26105.1 hypothetical protein COD66_28225 [Bacillus cereus]